MGAGNSVEMKHEEAKEEIVVLMEGSIDTNQEDPRQETVSGERRQAISMRTKQGNGTEVKKEMVEGRPDTNEPRSPQAKRQQRFIPHPEVRRRILSPVPKANLSSHSR